MSMVWTDTVFPFSLTTFVNAGTGFVTKFKNLSDVHSILPGAAENDFQLVLQKET